MIWPSYASIFSSFQALSASMTVPLEPGTSRRTRRARTPAGEVGGRRRSANRMWGHPISAFEV